MHDSFCWKHKKLLHCALILKSNNFYYFIWFAHLCPLQRLYTATGTFFNLQRLRIVAFLLSLGIERFRDQPSKLSAMEDHKVAIFLWLDRMRLSIVGIEAMHRAISFLIQPRCLLLIVVLSIFLILALSGSKRVWSFSLFICLVDLVRIVEPDFAYIVWSIIEFGTLNLMGRFPLNLIWLIEWVVPVVLDAIQFLSFFTFTFWYEANAY